MTWISTHVGLQADDPDYRKGAVEGAPEGQGNVNAQGPLDEYGLPYNLIAIAEDVLGANEDETQG